MEEIAPKPYLLRDLEDDMVSTLRLHPTTNFGYVGEVLSGRILLYGAKLEEKGLNALKSGDYNAAVIALGTVLELRIARYGEYGLDCLTAYYLYGVALLYKARQDPSRKYGEDISDSANGSKDPSREYGEYISYLEEMYKALQEETSANRSKDPSRKYGEDEYKEDEPILDHAWKNLLVAWQVQKKRKVAYSMEQVGILEAMGVVSMERGDVRNSLKCFENAHLQLEQLGEEYTLRLLDLYPLQGNFRLCSRLVTTFEVEKAGLYCRKAILICNARMQSLVKPLTVDMDQTSDDQFQVGSLSSPTNLQRIEEIKELKELLGELEQIQDLEQVNQSQKSAFFEKLLKKINVPQYKGCPTDLCVIWRSNMTANYAESSLKKPALISVPKEYKKHLQPAADVITKEGLKAMKLGDYNKAERMLSRALEIRTAVSGEYAIECYNNYYLLGIALLHKFRIVVGKLPKPMDRSTSESSSKAEMARKEILDHAWKNLSIAKEIVEKQLPKDALEKVEILEAMGEVFSEQDDIKTSLDFYLEASFLLESLVERHSLRLAELNFRICLMLVSHSDNKETLYFWKRGLFVCKARLEWLSNITNIADIGSMLDGVDQPNDGQLLGKSETFAIDQEELEELKFLRVLLGDLEKIKYLDQVPENRRSAFLEEILKKMVSSKCVGKVLDPWGQITSKRRRSPETAEQSEKKCLEMDQVPKCYKSGFLEEIHRKVVSSMHVGKVMDPGGQITGSKRRSPEMTESSEETCNDGSSP